MEMYAQALLSSVVILTVNIGVVNRPHAKNSRKMTTAA
jgi:hypothetical protein